MAPEDQPTALPEEDYRLVRRHEADPREFEVVGTSIIEVTVRWGHSIVHVAHLDIGQSFALTTRPARQLPALPALLGGFGAGGTLLAASAATGAWTFGALGSAIALAGAGASAVLDRSNDDSRRDGTRFVVDAEVLGGASELSVIDSASGTPMFVFARGSRGEIETGEATRSLDDVAMDLHGRSEVPIVMGNRYRIEVGSLTVSARIVARGRRIARGQRPDTVTLWAGLGALVAMSMLVGAALATTAQSPSLIEDEYYDTTIHDLERIMSFASEHAPMERPVEDRRAVERSSAIGRTHHDAAGSMGRPDTAQRDRRYTLASTDTMPHLARENARDVIAHRGIFAALGAPGSVANAEGPASPFGAMTASGRDDVTFTGNMTADLAGVAFGYDGLGRGGIGFGGGGTGEGTIGTSPFGFMGSGSGACGCGEGMGGLGTLGTLGSTLSRGRHMPDPHLPPRPVTLGPVLRCGPSDTLHGTRGCEGVSEGTMPADAIRRVVLRNLGQVQYCHEQGLRENPALAGRVAIRFVIGGDGNVVGTAIAENSVAVPSVGTCIASAVRRWTFPSPEGGGVVTVTYPFVLHAPE